MSRVPAARLVVRGTPRTGESLRGFVLRIAEANGYRGMAPLLQLARLPPTFVSRSSALQNLADLFDGLVEVDDLQARSHCSRIERAVRHRNTTISVIDVNLAHPKVCTICLKESGFARMVWDLRVVVACWRHGCYLLDHCSVCRRQLTWARKALTACPCGANLMNQRTGDASPSILEFSQRLETMLESKNGCSVLIHRRLRRGKLGQFQSPSSFEPLRSSNEALGCLWAGPDSLNNQSNQYAQ
jgi:hypothetical protein